MARYDGRANLIQNSGKLTPEKARENGQKGGIASGEARRRKRTFRELVDKVLELRVADDELRERLAESGLEEHTHDFAIILAAVTKAEKGDIEAARFLRDTRGEKPTEALQMSFDKPVKSMDLSKLSDAELEALAEQVEG